MNLEDKVKIWPLEEHYLYQLVLAYPTNLSTLNFNEPIRWGYHPSCFFSLEQTQIRQAYMPPNCGEHIQLDVLKLFSSSGHLLIIKTVKLIKSSKSQRNHCWFENPIIPFLLNRPKNGKGNKPPKHHQAAPPKRTAVLGTAILERDFGIHQFKPHLMRKWFRTLSNSIDFALTPI